MGALPFSPWSAVALSQPSRYQDFPAVLDNHRGRWVPSADELGPFAAEYGASVREQLSTSGCLLFRGFPLKSAQDFEDFLDTLQIPLSDNYDGGVSPRRAITSKVFTSTEAGGKFLIPPHNEMSYLPRRPSSIAFFCDIEPEQYGETPIFHTRAMPHDLPAEIVRKMRDLGILYRRFSAHKPSRWNVEKTLDQVFGTNERQGVQAMLDAMQARSVWDANGNVTFDVLTPAFVRHPATGAECLNLVIFNKHAHGLDTALFKERWSPLQFVLANAMIRWSQSRPRPFMKTLWGDGTEITRQETQTIQHNAWRHSLLFRWKKGDVLLLDNILWGHGRLNVKGPRRILAALGKPYDVFAMQGDSHAS